MVEQDVRLVILQGAIEKNKRLWNKSTEYQEGFTAGCRFIADIIEELELRRVQKAIPALKN